ncbi:ABC transporter permease [Streptomyces sp. NPDC013157]|uniref:ABC transporter permease n=1 Tax=unclassified Streptomyces TaxID=2593676 RepID=UPI00368085C7
MTTTPTPLDTQELSLAPRVGLIRGTLSSVAGKIGVGLGGVILTVIVFGRFVAPYDPRAINLAPPFSKPSGAHLLGTDELGRDVLSRLLEGGGQVLLIPLVAVVISVLIGGGLGAVAAYRGGRLDGFLRRSFDLVISMPVLLLSLIAVAALKPSFWVLVLVVVVADAPRAGRTVRTLVNDQISADYVLAARARGESMSSVLLREIAPNIVAPVAADVALRITYGIIAIATLSFLGLGAQPPHPDWGLMINENRGGLTFSPLAVLAPAAALALVSVAFNLTAEAIAQHVAGDEKVVEK